MANKSVRIVFYCTNKEEEELKKQAKASGISRGEYIRRKVFYLPKDTCLWLEQLKEYDRKIGVNINQVVRSCNSKRFITTRDYQELRDDLSRIDEKYAELIRDLKELSDKQFQEWVRREEITNKKIKSNGGEKFGDYLCSQN